MKLKKCLLLRRKVMTKVDNLTKSRDISLPTKVHIVKSIALTIQMWELDHKEGWALKNCCFQTVVLVKTLESPLDSKEIKPVSPKGNQSWIFIRRTDAEAKAPKLWLPDAKRWLIGKDPDAGKIEVRRRREQQRMRWLSWHHQFNEHEFEQTLGDNKGQGSLACCSPWGCK